MMNATAAKTTCPAWCHIPAAEHANGAPHVGQVALTAELFLIVSQESGQPVQAELFGREAVTYEGGIALDTAELALLANETGRVAAAAV